MSKKAKKILIALLLLFLVLFLAYILFFRRQLPIKSSLTPANSNQNLPSQTADCIDSDGGLNVHTYGEITMPKYNNRTFKDECESDFNPQAHPNSLAETVCSSTDTSAYPDAENHSAPIEPGQTYVSQIYTKQGGDPLPGKTVYIRCPTGPCSNGACPD